MSTPITLTLRAALDGPVHAEGLTPDRLAMLTEREIAGLPIVVGRRTETLGDLFTVRGGLSLQVRIEGDLRQLDGLGARMMSGELVMDGDAGQRVGAGMSGGWLEAKGSVGDDAGIAMAGGTLRVQGNAGDRVGAAHPGASKGMTGGEILVNGDAGSDVAAHARRAVVVIAGSTGEHAGRAMIAGTLLVLGRTGPFPGLGNKRGSIVACGPIDVPPTYRFACTYKPPHLRLLMTYLRRTYGLSLDQRFVDGRYHRYCGDAGEPGKGEILQWAADA